MKIFKRVLAIFIALCMIVGSANIQVVWALGDGNYIYEILDDESVMITQYVGNDTEKLEIPEKIGDKDVIKLGEYGHLAFSGCEGLKEIRITDKISDIAGRIFMECKDLIAINVDNNSLNYSSEEGVLYSKDKTKLICCPGGMSGEYTISPNVASIEEHAFGYCQRLEGIVISPGVTSIGEGAFYHCEKIKSVAVPSGVTKIPYGCFEGCTNLESISFSENISSIENGAFSSCTSLKDIYYSGMQEQWERLFIQSYHNSDFLNATVHFKDGTTLNQSGEDYEYQELTSDTIEITAYTGTDQTLTIPSSINGQTVTSIGEYAFNGSTAIKEVTIPSSVTTIKPYAFYRSSAEKITVPAAVTSIGQFAFQDCRSLAEIAVDDSNPNYSSDDGVLYNKGKTLLISCPAGKKGTYAIPSGVTNINDNAFFACSGLTEITIPSSVTSIQEAAFNGCSGLTGITIPSGVTSIGSMAFASCSNLADITIPSSVTSMGINAFSDCTGLKTATIQFSVNRLEAGAFSNCTGLENITIPSSVTAIGQEAFSNCRSLKTVTMPTSVTSVQDSAFANCSSLGDVYYSGTEEQWNHINISGSGSGMASNQPLLNATIHLSNGTTINGPEKDADYKIGTISAYDQTAKTVRIAGQIYAAADNLDFSGMSQLVSAKEQVIATFRNGKVTKIESVKDAIRLSVTVAECSKPPITLQNNGYLEDCQDILAQLEVVSDYPKQAFQGADDIGVYVREMLVSVETEGFCISRSRQDRNEEAASMNESIDKKLLFGEKAEYEYTIYVQTGFTYTQEELPYLIKASAETESGAVSGQKTLYALFEYTEQELDLSNAKQELDQLKNGDPLLLERDLLHYLSPEQIDVMESYIYTWLAEVNYAYKYQGSSDIRNRIMKKTGLDPEADVTSGEEKAITHIIVDTAYGKKTIELTLDLGRPDSQGNLYPAYGRMYYEILEKNAIPEGMPVNGQIGKASYADMGSFVACVAKADEDSLHNTYQWEALREELTAGVLIDKTVISIIGEQNGSFSDCTFTVYAEPLVKYSKMVKISSTADVDVRVYNMTGKEVGSLTGSDAEEASLNARTKAGEQMKNVQLYANGDTKTIYLAGDDYYLNLFGKGTGTMNYEVEEIVNEETKRNVRFLELQLQKELQYEGYVFRPLNIDSDLYALRTIGKDQEVFYADEDTYKAIFKRILQLSLSQQSTSLSKNKTVQLSASMLPLDASNPNLQWTSDNASIAKVDSNGLVTAVGAGKATITVSTKDGSFLKQFCIIDVAGGNSSSGGSSGSSGWSGGGFIPSVETENTPVVVKLHYVLQFDMNGGTNLSRKTMTLLENDSPGIMPKVQRKDYTFDGWYTQQDGGEKVNGDKPLGEATTLYARWAKTAVPAKTAAPTLNSKKKGQMQVSFQTVSGAAGYEIAYSTNKTFTSAKTKEAGAAVKSKTISGLKAGKKYYVRVRAYSMDSMKNKIYGAYSTVKSVKIKK